MNLVQFGKRILSLGPKGTPQQRLTNVDDPKTDFDAVNLRSLKSYGGGGGSKPNFNLDIQTFAFDQNEGIPILFNGGVYGDIDYVGETSFISFPISMYDDGGVLVTFMLDRFNCNSEILIEATGVYVTDLLPESGTSWTVPANNSALGAYIGFQSAGLKELTFVATACGVSKSVTLFFNVETSSNEACGESSSHNLHLYINDIDQYIVYNSELNYSIQDYNVLVVLIPKTITGAETTVAVMSNETSNTYLIAEVDPLNTYDIGIFYRDSNNFLCSWCDTFRGYTLSESTLWLPATPCVCSNQENIFMWVDGTTGDIYMNGVILYKGVYYVKGTIAPVENPLAVTMVDSTNYGKTWFGGIMPSVTQTYLIDLKVATMDGCEYCLNQIVSFYIADTHQELYFSNCNPGGSGSIGSGGSGSVWSPPVGGKYLK